VQAYTVEEVADMLHVGRDKIYYLLRTRQLGSLVGVPVADAGLPGHLAEAPVEGVTPRSRS
jgi:hypothetical protein